MDPIVIKGSYFFYQNSGERFFIRGAEYQDLKDDFNTSSSFIDALEDGARCQRDIPHLKALGINALYIYYLRPGASHASCMQQFRDAGIYILAGLSGTTEDEVQLQGWTYLLEQRFINLADSLAKYSNLLGFWIMGNAIYFPLIKAAIRDLKEHGRTAGYRSIPIGGGALTLTTVGMLDYLRCQSLDTSVDFQFFLGYNLCPPFSLSQFEEGMNVLASSKPDIPIILTAGACGWDDLVNSNVLLDMNSENYTTIHSGGYVVNYFDVSLRDGRISNASVQIFGSQVNRRPVFTPFASQIAEIKPFQIAMSEYTPTQSLQPSCSTTFTRPITRLESGVNVTSTMAFRFATNVPPKPDMAICKCMMSSLTCIQPNSDQRDRPLDWRTYGFSRNSSRENLITDKVCSQNETWCAGTATNVELGRYGAFSGCNYTERASWALNQLYIGRGSDAKSCIAAGGEIRGPLTAPSRNCFSILQQAKADGTGMVTQTALLDPWDESLRRKTLSTAAKAGIGVAVFIFIIFAAVLFVFGRRRKQTILKSKSASVGVAELPGSVISRSERVEIGGEERQELAGDEFGKGETKMICELPTEHNTPVELDATETYRKDKKG